MTTEAMYALAALLPEHSVAGYILISLKPRRTRLSGSKLLTRLHAIIKYILCNDLVYDHRE